MRSHFAIIRLACATFLAVATACHTPASAGGGAEPAGMAPSVLPAVQAASMEQAGEYLTIVGGCNDCHTQGWIESRGKVASADRFAGLNVGFRGAWGTSYGKNLRTVTQRITEDRWVSILTTADGGDGKPPMPWWNTAKMSDRDLRAMYRYIKALGPKPNGVPRGLPVGKEPTGPWVWLDPSARP